MKSLPRHLPAVFAFLVALALVTGCANRSGGGGLFGKKSPFGDKSGANKLNPMLGPDGIPKSVIDLNGVIDLANTVLGEWNWPGGYNAQGQFIGAGGLYDKDGNYVGDTGGYGPEGDFRGEEGQYTSTGEFAGPAGGFDKFGNRIEFGSFDASGNQIGFDQLTPSADFDTQSDRVMDDRFTESGADLGFGPVYFGYDRANLNASEYGKIDNIAQRLFNDPGENLRLLGHCDERGSRAYNLSLGERRALAVKNYLITRGIDESRLLTVSYGSEQPADSGHNESAWRQNRRVEFVFSR